MYNFIESNFIKRQKTRGTKIKTQINKTTKEQAQIVSQEKMIMKVVVGYIALFSCPHEWKQKYLFADKHTHNRWRTVIILSCNWHLTTPQPSVEICAVQCTATADCKSFASRGDNCGVLATCPESCTEVTGSDESWNIYCPEGKALWIINTCKLKKRLLLRCIHHFKTDLINDMDPMRISGTEPSSVIFSHRKQFKNWKCMPKSAKTR